MAAGHDTNAAPMTAHTRFEELLRALSHEFEVLEKQKEDIANENSKLRGFNGRIGKQGDTLLLSTPMQTPTEFDTETPRYLKAPSPQSSSNSVSNSPDMPSCKAPPKTQASSKPVANHFEPDMGRSVDTFESLTEAISRAPLKEVNPQHVGHGLEDIIEKEENAYESKKESHTTKKSLKSVITRGDQSLIDKDGHPSYLIMALETIPAFVIMSNALTMAFQADAESDSNVWDIFEAVFVSCYFIECVLKLYILNCHGYFLGADYLWNWFDFICLLASLVDLAFTYVMKLAVSDNNSYQLLKMVRVARLTRLVRVLRYRFFDELRAMVLGVISGIRVLFWAIILLFYCIFFLGVFMQSLFGEDELEFATVPHSMFTVFRCYTDGCTTIDGDPLSDRLFRNHGWWFMIGYILTFMFITIGVFNLIMAIFIDNVVSSSLARKLQYISDNTARMEERIKEALTYLIDKHVRNVENGDVQMSFSHENEEDAKISITREEFNRWLVDPEMMSMLEDVTIETSTRGDLFDVLDVDMGGELEIGELLDGLMRLRGPITKSDIVAVRLKVSYLTKIIEGMTEMVEHLWQKLAMPEEFPKLSIMKEAGEAAHKMRSSSHSKFCTHSGDTNGYDWPRPESQLLKSVARQSVTRSSATRTHASSIESVSRSSEAGSSTSKSSTPLQVGRTQRYVTPRGSMRT